MNLLANPIAALWRVPLKKAVWETDQTEDSSNNPSKSWEGLESQKLQEKGKEEQGFFFFDDWDE